MLFLLQFGLRKFWKSTSNIHSGCVWVPGVGFWILVTQSIKSVYPGDVCPEKWVNHFSGCRENISKHFSLGAWHITTCKHCWPWYLLLWKRDTFLAHHLTDILLFLSIEIEFRGTQWTASHVLWIRQPGMEVGRQRLIQIAVPFLQT